MRNVVSFATTAILTSHIMSALDSPSPPTPKTPSSSKARARARLPGFYYEGSGGFAPFSN